MISQEVLKQINQLETKHCSSCEEIDRKNSSVRMRICKSCPIGKELFELGNQLRVDKDYEVLKKGEDMTFSDIRFCIQRGVDKEKVKKAAGMSKERTFRRYMNSHGYDIAGREIT